MSTVKFFFVCFQGIKEKGSQEDISKTKKWLRDSWKVGWGGNEEGGDELGNHT